MLPVLVGDVCASVLRVAGEGRGFPEAAYDVCRRGAGSLPLGAKWRLSCAGAIALCLWMAMPYAVEITDGQNFGGGQGRTGRSSYAESRFRKAWGDFVYGLSLIAQTRTYSKYMMVRTGRVPRPSR